MAYASQQWTKNLLGQTLKAAQEDGLLGGGGSVEGDMYYGIDKYTEDEVCVGEWINGKPLYRKFYYLNNITLSNGGVAVGSAIDNLSIMEDIISSSAYRISSESGKTVLYGPISLWRDSSTSLKAYTISSTASIKYISIEYTKTTDAENSFNPSMITNNLTVVGAAYENYSEDEIVVGKWIDGKPVYRKCFNFTSPSAATDGNAKTYNLPNISIDSVIDYGVFIKNSNGVVFKNGNNGDAAFKTDFLNAWIRNNNHATSPNSLAIIIGTSTAFHSRPMHLILEYTKTTDAENSFTPSMVLGGVSNETASDADVQEVFA